MTSVLALGIDPATSTFLQMQGYELSSIEASLQELCERALGYEPNVVLFGERTSHGATTVAQMRRQNITVPVIRIASGPRDKDWAYDAAVFLDSGGDDIIAGPAQPEEVAARLRALLRRAGGIPSTIRTYEMDGQQLVVNHSTTRVEVNGSPLQLTAYEMTLLLVLSSAGGDCVSRKAVWEAIYETEWRVGASNTTEVFIHHLRARFGPARILLECVRGKGYRLLGRVS